MRVQAVISGTVWKALSGVSPYNPDYILPVPELRPEFVRIPATSHRVGMPAETITSVLDTEIFRDDAVAAPK
jgi:hypothetical protein